MLRIWVGLLILSSQAFAIRNGETVDHFDHPHIIKIEVKGSVCSGIRISDEYALTAAHCFRKNPASFWVKFVTADKKVMIRKKLLKKSIIIKSTKLDQELALIKINAPLGIPYLEINPFQRGLYEAGQNFTIFGFGYNQQGTLGTLHRGNIHFVSDYFPSKNEYPMISLKPSESDQLACPGDSGGPLILETENGPQLAGIVSYISTTEGSMPKEDEIAQCKKANRSMYIPIHLHMDFLNQYL